MAKSEHDVRVTPSLLDRLIDDSPRSPRDPAESRAEGIRELKAAVQRDLESLLNSRNANWDLGTAYAEAWRSVITYGMPDFSTLVMTSPNDQRRLRSMVETAIRNFEPRLTGVTTTLLPSAPTDRTLRMRIDGRLLIDPAPEAVTFDVIMPLQSSRYEVKDVS